MLYIGKHSKERVKDRKLRTKFGIIREIKRVIEVREWEQQNSFAEHERGPFEPEETAKENRLQENVLFRNFGLNFRAYNREGYKGRINKRDREQLSN